MTDIKENPMDARVAQLSAAAIPPAAAGWFAHRTASSRALHLLDLMAERTGEPRWLAAAGYERGTRATIPDEARRAASQLSEAMRSADLPGQYQLLLAELLVLLRDDARLAELLASGKLRSLSETRRRMLEADLANPFRTPGLSEDAWLRSVRPLLGDLAPVSLGPAAEVEGHEPLDRLTTDIEPGSAGGELVSVIVSSYRPGPALDTAVRSILAQTWADLEVLVIDDASGAEFSEVYARLEALDQRVRVIHQPENSGTYVARNTAIDQARGTYVTFQDADDWSHPERIERQVAVLAQEPLVHSVRSRSLRTSGTLVFSRQGNAVLAPGAVTLMFRRDQVWPVLGSFDVVRKAADTEFHERITAALPGYGVDLQEPLLWYRAGEESLSRSEFRAAWRHSARMLYHSAWLAWHDQIRLGAAARLERTTRRFPTPQRFRLDQTAPPEEFDLAVIGDWRGGGGAARDAAEWMSVLAADGVRIAIVHAESLNFDGRRPPGLMASVQQLVAAGTVGAVAWDEPVVTKAVVALEPEVLEFLPDTEPGTQTSAMVVLLDATPRAPGLLADTEAIVADRWRARVVWSCRGTQSPPASDSETLEAGFPVVIPTERRTALHRPQQVVVVVPLGIDPAVLDETAMVASALAGAEVDVRVRAASGVRQAIGVRVPGLSPRILWVPSAEGAAAALAVATDVVLIGSPRGTDYERLVEEAQSWGVRTHLRSAADSDGESDQPSAIDFVELIRGAAQPSAGTQPTSHARDSVVRSVLTWYANVSALAGREDASRSR